MNTIFGLLFFIALILFFIGLANPKWVIRGERRSRKKVLLVYGVSVIVFMILTGFTAPKSDFKQSAGFSKTKQVNQISVTKQEGEKAFKQFQSITKKYDTVYNGFKATITGLSNGTIDKVTAYNQLDSLESNALDVFNEAENLNVPQRYSDSLQTLQITTSDLQLSINDIKKYLDDNKTSTMARATKELSVSQQGIQATTTAVVAQAMKDGYIPGTKSKN